MQTIREKNEDEECEEYLHRAMLKVDEVWKLVSNYPCDDNYEWNEMKK